MSFAAILPLESASLRVQVLASNEWLRSQCGAFIVSFGLMVMEGFARDVRNFDVLLLLCG